MGKIFLLLGVVYGVMLTVQILQGMIVKRREG